jgi:anthranilate synthase component 1
LNQNPFKVAPGAFSQRLDHSPDLPGLAEVFPGQFPYLLESSARGALGSHSLLLFAGDEVLVLDAEGGVSGPGAGRSFFERLESWYQIERTGTKEAKEEGAPDATPASIPTPSVPFTGGWFIYLGYEMAAEVESTLGLPPNRTGMPDAIAHRCHGAIIVFHDPLDPDRDRSVAVAESNAVLDQIVSCIDRIPVQARSAGVAELSCLDEEDPQRYKASVSRIHDYLLAGDVFQVNISRSWSGAFCTDADPLALYRSLRHFNPAPFAGLLRWQDSVILSSSPERLVQIRDGKIQTRPIAGTRPRGTDIDQDRALSDELIGNPKERAEHIMLIDLERNDLGRVCKSGTVEVNELMMVESFAHVHHIVSNVRGDLLGDASPVDAIRAVFPGGTITGCPKVRCMEIIAELEGEGRGYYTGSMGYLGRDGSLDLNILIRSMLVQGRKFEFRTGGGIVADSVPDHEVCETRDKARGMLMAVGSRGNMRANAGEGDKKCLNA